MYALLVERQFTKEQILETYLNHVYFGFGIYGVEAASQRFWGKDASSLRSMNLQHWLLLFAALVNIVLVHYPLSAQRRRNIILGSMKN